VFTKAVRAKIESGQVIVAIVLGHCPSFMVSVLYRMEPMEANGYEEQNTLLINGDLLDNGERRAVRF